VRLIVKNAPVAAATLALLLPCVFIYAAGEPADAAVATGKAILWSDPTDAASRNLVYGIGGEESQPQAPFTFIKEDLNATSPKLDLKDANGVKWTAKLGLEARPETAASRLVWAAGYFVPEDYYLANIHVSGVPDHLQRGEKLIIREGATVELPSVRFKREPKGEKKIGSWTWKDNPFQGTRQWNGLRVMMALVNNWDLKDENNSIFRSDSGNIYMVTDLGATFSSDGRSYPPSQTKDNLDKYLNSKFIERTHDGLVDFAVPARPQLPYFVNPKEYMNRVHLEWIGKNIPVDDARWIGAILARLSPDQIRDAFRASGYSPTEIDGFSQVILHRISELNAL
jgi:hypothetical protein